MRDLRAIEAYWSEQAATFDDEPDHGLGTPELRAAWASRFDEWIPKREQRVLDLGCGTGSLSVLLAQLGHTVMGIDLSPAMVALARAKTAKVGLEVEFSVGDASAPAVPDQSFDVVLSRHVVWTIPEPPQALERWARLLSEEGRLVLVEGRWSELRASSDLSNWGDGGVSATDLAEAIDPLFELVEHHPLSHDAALWGKPVADERYALVAQYPRPQPDPLGLR